MHKNWLILQLMFLIAFQSFTQTVLPSILSCNQTLTLAGSPYIIDTTITIQPGCSLTVEAGVEIQMADFRHLIVKGKVDFLGTSSSLIHLHAKNNQWGIIYLDSADQKSTFNYTIIENATFGPDGSDQNFTAQVAAISADHCSFELNNCTFKNNEKSVFGLHGDNFIIKNCVFDSTNAGENILLQFADNSIVSENIFYFLAGSGDHIDFDASKNITVSNNYAYGGESDAIDIGQRDSIACSGVLIANNYLYNMLDKGITNGEGSANIKIEYNIIQGCDVGIGAKDKAQVNVDHNTLSGNRIGVKAYDHLVGLGGGNLVVSNTIIAGSIDSAYYVDPTASLTISYSLSNTEALPGSTNIIGDPKFISNNDLHLTSLSDAIDKGDPDFMPDPDGTRSDIGKFYYDEGLGLKPNNFGKELIYPNPNNGKFKVIMTPNYKDNHFIVLSSIGESVYEVDFFGDKTEFLIDLSMLSTGVYCIRLQSENSISTRKFIIY